MLSAKLTKRFHAGAESRGFELQINLEASRQTTVIFGPSGAGKSLLLDLLAGFQRPDSGRVLLDDQLLLDMGTGVFLPPQARRCGYLFQRPALFPHLTLRENLLLAAGSLPKLERHRRVGQLLDAFRLSDLAARLPREVSGGQRQRCAIARALVAKPAILLLDEPSNGLDQVLRREFYELLQQVLEDFAVPLLLVTHDLDEAFLLADQMLVLVDGKIQQSGRPREILTQPATTAVANLLGLFNLLPSEIELLDPGANRSRLRWNDYLLEGPYYPARLKGDQVTVCVRRDEIAATPKMGKAEKGALVLPLAGTAETTRSALLSFPGGLIVEMPLAEFLENRHHREWVLSFPQQELRIL